MAYSWYATRDLIIARWAEARHHADPFIRAKILNTFPDHPADF